MSIKIIHLFDFFEYLYIDRKNRKKLLAEENVAHKLILNFKRLTNGQYFCIEFSTHYIMNL